MDGKEFLGRGLKFPLQVDARTGKLAMVSEEEDIREAIGILLRTTRGERVMRPEFGSNTMEYAFAPVSSSMIQGISYEISRQLAEQEPRITDVEVNCQQADQYTGAVIVQVSYTVRNTNNRYNHVYPFYVTEGSEGGGAE
ncbi:MAG: GPW/gp25 family protein [Oscillospiraceae bacterium]|nr:GPW/gp25 family protein [Oscillospiraceae bacterium]